jgi:hypothetical protein
MCPAKKNFYILKESLQHTSGDHKQCAYLHLEQIKKIRKITIFRTIMNDYQNIACSIISVQSANIQRRSQGTRDPHPRQTDPFPSFQ